MMRSAEYTDFNLLSNSVQRRKTGFLRPKSGHKPPIVKKRSHTYREVEDVNINKTKATYDYVDIDDITDSKSHRVVTAPRQSGVESTPPTAKEKIGDSCSDEETSLLSKVDNIQKTLSVIMNQMCEIQSRQSDFDARLSALEKIQIDANDQHDYY